jgi:hypothetical protein
VGEPIPIRHPFGFQGAVRRTELREPAVREFGPQPTFAADTQATIRVKSRKREHVIALRAEFVVKPGKETNVSETINAILEHSFGRECEFLQALVLVSEIEPRLVTVITFWNSNGFAEARERRANWMRKKLAEYLDMSPRVQSFCARVLGGHGDGAVTGAARTDAAYPSVTQTFAALAS